MDTRIHLITLLCIGWIAYTNNSGLPLELTQFQSGGNVTLVCSAINTTINMSFTHWYMDEVRVLTAVFAGNVCGKHRPNSTGDTPAYRYDLYTSTDVSVICDYTQHNMTLTTTQYTQAGAVWRCEDQRFRVSNNLTLAIPGTTDKSTSPLTDSVTTMTTDSDTHGFHKTTYKTSSQLTTLANLTTLKITSAPRDDNQDDIMYIAAGTGGGIFILIIIVICVCVVRTRRKGTVTQATSDADNGAEVSENPLYVTYQVEPVDNKVHFNDNAPEHLLALGGAVDVGDLNDVRDKTPKHQSAVGGAINVDDLYAVPDKTPKNQPAEGGAVNIGDLYAVPDMPMKTKNGTYSTWSEADNEYSEI